MNKKLTLFLILISIGILYIFNIERVIQNQLSLLNKTIKNSYINVVTIINNSIDKYINQLDYITTLKNSNDEHLKYKVLYDVQTNKLKELNRNLETLSSFDSKLELEKVKVLSYYQFNDNSRVIINKDDLKSSKIYSLITLDGFSAGIVLNKNQISIAHLNENIKCNYTVFIGKNNVPGITSGISDEGYILIKYVPIWKKISLNDDVITSSMDNIFPYGIKVGKVVKINIKDNIQEVLVTPYAKTLGNRDYYLYKSVDKINN